jgi:hypothetical protein
VRDRLEVGFVGGEMICRRNRPSVTIITSANMVALQYMVIVNDLQQSYPILAALLECMRIGDHPSMRTLKIILTLSAIIPK